jgi:hypothetical protein
MNRLSLAPVPINVDRSPVLDTGWSPVFVTGNTLCWSHIFGTPTGVPFLTPAFWISFPNGPASPHPLWAGHLHRIAPLVRS